MRPNSRRDGGLDAIRGLAALAVVGYHSSLGFVPHRMTLFIGGAADPATALWTRWWFALLNGPAAVTLFFVLSGFVLTQRAFATRRADPLLRTAIKRYPRLAGPVLAVCVLAWLLFRLGLHSNGHAAALTGSSWLSAFAQDPGPSLRNALRQGLWRTLLHGDVSYNTSLWTMRVELIGSFVALAAAAVMVRVLPVSRALAVAVGLAAYVFWRDSPLFLGAFLAGVTLSALLASLRLPRLPLLLGLGLCAAALYGFGFNQASGDYGWVARLPPGWLAHAALPVSCSVLVILAVETCPRLRTGLGTPVLRWLGEVSFALYLVHFLVIISAGSFVRVALDPWGAGVATVGAYVATFAVSLAAATPLSWFDRWLMARLNGWVDRLLPRQGRAAGRSSPAAIPR